ncbi:hypothetical protein AADR41_40615, partial [Streptomyces sp. CLV115]
GGAPGYGKGRAGGAAPQGNSPHPQPADRRDRQESAATSSDQQRPAGPAGPAATNRTGRDQKNVRM